MVALMESWRVFAVFLGLSDCVISLTNWFLRCIDSGTVVDCSIVSFLCRRSFVKKLDEYLKIADAAEFLGVSINTLRKWTDPGDVESAYL